MHRSVAFCLCLAVCASTTMADAQPSCTTIEAAEAFIRINSSNGSYQGSTRYPEGQALQVIVDRKNPFKYEYRVEVTARPLNEAMVTSFLSLIPGFGLDGIPVGTPPPPPPPPQAAAASACTQLNKEWNDLSSEVNRATGLKTLVQKGIGISDAYNGFMKETDVESFTVGACTAALESATGLQKVLPEVINLGTLPKDIDQLAQTSAAALTTFEAALAALHTSNPTQAMACEQNLQAELKTARDLPAQVATMKKAVDGLVSAKASFEGMQAVINSVMANDNAFSEQRRPPTQDEATGVRIVVARKNRRVQSAVEQQIADIQVQVGRSRFSVGAGFGMSGVPQRTVIRRSAQISVPATPATATSPAVPASTRVGTVFAYDPNSDWGLRPMVALNGHLWDFRVKRLGDVAVNFTTAVALGAGNDQLKVEYLFGPSLGLLQNRLNFTLGAYLGRPETLAGGFEIDKEVPTALQDPLPVNRDWDAGLGFSITYRVR